MKSARHSEMRELAKRLGLNKPLTVFDVETTGSFLGKDRVIQIGFLKIFQDGSVYEKQIDIDPEMDIPKEATNVHGITNDDLAGKPKFRQIAKQLETDVFSGSDLCGYNVKFDIGFVNEEFKRALGRKVLDEEMCIVDPFRIFIAMEGRGLSDAVKFFLGEELTNAHTALADARATARVLLKQMIRYEQELPPDVEGLDQLFNKAVPEGYLDPQRKLFLRDGKAVLTFGKNKGVALEDVPADYLQWMIGAEFGSEVMDAVRAEQERRKAKKKLTKVDEPVLFEESENPEPTGIVRSETDEV